MGDSCRFFWHHCQYSVDFFRPFESSQGLAWVLTHVSAAIKVEMRSIFLHSMTPTMVTIFKIGECGHCNLHLANLQTSLGRTRAWHGGSHTFLPQSRLKCETFFYT